MTTVVSAIDQLTVQHRLWDSLVSHSQDMTKPAKSALAEDKVHTDESSTSQYSLIGDFLLQSNFKNTTEAS